MVLESTLVDRLCVQLMGLPDNEAILNSTAEILTDACGIHFSWLARPVEGGVMIHKVRGNRTQVSQGLLLRSGLGLGGKVYASGKLHAVDDYISSTSITHDYDGAVTPEGVQAMMGAPLVFGNRDYGVLFAGYRDMGCCGRAMQLLEGVAQRCAEAVFFGERVREAAEKAIREERRRAALSVQSEFDSTLEAIVKDLRDAELTVNDRVLSQRFRKIERQAMESGAQLRRSLNAFLTQPVSQDADTSAPAGGKKLIASREYDVLCRVAVGETNLEIAGAMNLSCNTVKTYLRNVMTKLGARNRIEAIVNAKELGLL